MMATDLIECLQSLVQEHGDAYLVACDATGDSAPQLASVEFAHVGTDNVIMLHSFV
jgi:hypothetical protein